MCIRDRFYTILVLLTVYACAGKREIVTEQKQVLPAVEDVVIDVYKRQTLDFMMDERARELFYEAQRRTDLIRLGKYTSADYVWPWKGGVAAGKSVESFYQVFPLPSDDVGSNQNLVQNEGY